MQTEPVQRPALSPFWISLILLVLALIPRWLIILMISRDVFILLASLLIILMIGWRVFKPTPYGKASTVLQAVTVFGVLYCNWIGDVVFAAEGGR